MKKIIMRTIALVLLAGASATSLARTIEMEVNGLVCAFCAQGIEKMLGEFPETEGVFVSLEDRIVAVDLRDGTDIDDARLRQAIVDAGYAVVAIERTDATLEQIRARVAADD